jgi:hypothetical protein
LRIPLLLIAKSLDELLDWHLLSKTELVLSSPETEMADQDVRVGGDPSDGASRVLAQSEIERG